MNKYNFLCVDIETVPSKDAMDYAPDFLPASNLVDEKKIEQSIWEKQKSWQSKTALDPLTGQILAIGYAEYSPDTEEPMITHSTDPVGDREAELLEYFWKRYTEYTEYGSIVGHNILQFDLPFLYLRSIKHGIEPKWTPFGEWNNSEQLLTDTMVLWNCKRYPKQYISLHNLAKFMGVGEKTMKGDKFAKLFYDIATRHEALEYLTNDLKLTGEIYQKFLI